MKIGDSNERHESRVPHKFQLLCPVVAGGIGAIGLFIVKSGESVPQFFLRVFVRMGGKTYPAKYF